ncbi:hypothetical protein VTN49DRAFT_3722 [Thermomyces lanuginosus]|uniref:uncharacterized protein n=1 Tax=Thermomyces lanuginosus TaxID=5541 RepID=UPI0037425850
MISHGQKKLLQKGSKERGQSDSGKEPTGKIKEGKSRNLGADKELQFRALIPGEAIRLLRRDLVVKNQAEPRRLVHFVIPTMQYTQFYPQQSPTNPVPKF